VIPVGERANTASTLQAFKAVADAGQEPTVISEMCWRLIQAACDTEMRGKLFN
jgi:hypothetical protein